MNDSFLFAINTNFSELMEDMKGEAAQEIGQGLLFL